MLFPIQTLPFILYGAGASAGDTTLTLSSFQDIDSNDITMTDLGTISYLTIDPGSIDEEQISFTGVTQNVNGTATLTGVKSVAFKTPYNETSGLSKSHTGGSIAVLSNTAGFYNYLFSSINKLGVIVGTTAAGTLASDFEAGDVVDGYTLLEGDSILIKNQTDAKENGIYIVNASGAPTRAGYAATDATIRGSIIFIAKGSTQNASIWRNTNTTAITIGVTDITYINTLVCNITGNAATVTTNADLTGDVISSGNATSYNTVVPIAKGGTGQNAKTASFDALSPTTTKGDIIVHNGTNNVRLPIGADNTFPKADSTQPSGIRWIAVPPGSGINADFSAYPNKATPTGSDIIAINDLADSSAVKYVELSKISTRLISLKIFGDDTTITTGDGKLIFCIPEELNGYNLTKAHAMVSTVSSSGAPTIQIRNVTDSVDMLSTAITIDANEFTSYTAATAPVIDTTHDDVATGDRIAIDVDGAGVSAKGLTILLTFGL